MAGVRAALPQVDRLPSEHNGESLSQREREVLELVGQGLTNGQIGEQLGISENTAKFHVTSIMRKLGVSSRTEAVAIAIQRRLV